MHLGSHVLDGAELGPEDAGTVFALHRCSEAEIVNLQLVIVVEQNILDFNVPM